MVNFAVLSIVIVLVCTFAFIAALEYRFTRTRDWTKELNADPDQDYSLFDE